MSSKRFLTLVLGTLIVSCASTLLAQVNVPSPRFNPTAGDLLENTRPIADPGAFGYDAQAFAPLEFTSSEELEPNIGFYFVYDRTYTSINKADGRADVIDGDSTGVANGNNYSSGNRFELGWTTKQGDGWGAVFEHTLGSFFSNGQDAIVQTPLLVTTSFANFELNRSFRQSVSRGGSFEPYVGFRYNSVSDNTLEDGLLAPAGGNRFKQNAANDLFGGHVGGRYTNRRGRIRTSLDAAVAASFNRSRYFATDLVTNGLNPAGVPITPTVSEFFDEDTAFVPAIDLRLEMAYNLSRDIGLRTGFQFIYLFDGVGRADTRTTTLNPNSTAFGPAGFQGIFEEDFSAVSFTLGVEWKR